MGKSGGEEKNEFGMALASFIFQENRATQHLGVWVGREEVTAGQGRSSGKCSPGVNLSIN